LETEKKGLQQESAILQKVLKKSRRFAERLNLQNETRQEEIDTLRGMIQDLKQGENISTRSEVDSDEESDDEASVKVDSEEESEEALTDDDEDDENDDGSSLLAVAILTSFKDDACRELDGAAENA
jgi:hypothetical protein